MKQTNKQTNLNAISQQYSDCSLNVYIYVIEFMILAKPMCHVAYRELCCFELNMLLILNLSNVFKHFQTEIHAVGIIFNALLLNK